jgi:hypothetical protein
MLVKFQHILSVVVVLIGNGFKKAKPHLYQFQRCFALTCIGHWLSSQLDAVACQSRLTGSKIRITTQMMCWSWTPEKGRALKEVYSKRLQAAFAVLKIDK